MPVEFEPAEFLRRCGDAVPVEILAIDRAARFAALIDRRDDIGAHPVEVRANDNGAWVVIDVDVEVGQIAVVDIRRTERLAIGFGAADSDWPQALSLRPDFPRDLIHLMVVPVSDPVALCLSEETWSEARRRWTPAGYIRLIRRWLIDTAEGVLHRDEQIVEPFMPIAAARAIVPAATFATANVGRLMSGARIAGSAEEGRPVYRFEFDNGTDSPAFIATVMSTAPRLHGVLHRPPLSLAELLALFEEGDPGFNTRFDDAVRSWLNRPGVRAAHLLLLIQAPMLRVEGGEVERIDHWGFLLHKDVREVGIALDLWTEAAGNAGPVHFGRKEGPYGVDVAVEPVNVTMALDAGSAAAYNGREPSGQRIAAIGAGALGSQVLANLARMGELPDAVIDEDRLMPHNLARHAAWDENLVGWTKVEAARLMDERFRERATPMQSLRADASRLQAAGGDPVETVLANADIVLDMAASVAVSRRLARDGGTGGRRLSIFLSPSGFDLVVLAEDTERQVRLDELEMGYYAAVAGDAMLDGHLVLPAGRRYARSCRERSSLVPQTAVALHAAIATESVFAAFSDTSASAAVWRLDRETMQVRRITLDARPMRSFAIDGWTVMVCERLLDELAAQRVERLPSETGGVLLGEFDLDRKLVYVVHYLPAPPDSIEEPSGFVRGTAGLDQAIATICDRTLGMLRYVGEWHSHPDGIRAQPSGDDVLLYAHLALGMEIEDRPAIMLIIGADEVGVVIGAMA